jgi:hypothetical protein
MRQQLFLGGGDAEDTFLFILFACCRGPGARWMTSVDFPPVLIVLIIVIGTGRMGL